METEKRFRWIENAIKWWNFVESFIGSMSDDVDKMSFDMASIIKKRHKIHVKCGRRFRLFVVTRTSLDGFLFVCASWCQSNGLMIENEPRMKIMKNERKLEHCRSTITWGIKLLIFIFNGKTIFHLVSASLFLLLLNLNQTIFFSQFFFLTSNRKTSSDTHMSEILCSIRNCNSFSLVKKRTAVQRKWIEEKECFCIDKRVCILDDENCQHFESIEWNWSDDDGHLCKRTRRDPKNRL